MSEQKSKNPDFSESAVNLTNSPELRDMLVARRETITEVKVAEELLWETEQWQRFDIQQKLLGKLNDAIKETMSRLGGFQDIEQGLYALGQRRVTITYIPKLVRSILPKLAEALIEEVVNKKVMDGMLKGGVVTAAQAQTCSEEKENLAPIIKT